MAFETFYGNEKLKKTLLQHLCNHTLSHAVILEGEKGLGKRTLARLLAAGLLCEHDAPPCGECVICKNVLACNHADVLYFETEKHTKDNFKIDTVRQIRELAFISPNQSACKVFILAEADLMNAAAQNALLKVLEEPPAYAYFILLCERKSAFLETILSRCTLYRLERVSDALAADAVEALLPGPTREEIEKCVGLVGGNIGLVIDGLRGNEMLRLNEKALEVAQGIISGYEFDLMKALAEFESGEYKKMLPHFAQPLQNLFRDALAVRCDGTVDIKMNEQCARMLAQHLTKKQLFSLLEVTEELKKRAQRNMNQKLLLTWLCMALRTAAQYQ